MGQSGDERRSQRPRAPADLPEVKVLDDPAQLRAIASPERLRILQLFAAGEPLSVKEMAERLAQPHGRVHYHVRRLVQAGLLQEVGQREVRGITERFYYVTADRFETSRMLAAPPGARSARRVATRALVETVREFVDNAMQLGHNVSIGFQEGYLTQEEAIAVGRQLERLLEPYRTPRPGTLRVRFLLLSAWPKSDSPQGTTPST